MMSHSEEASLESRRSWAMPLASGLLLVYWLMLITATHIPKVPEPMGFRPSDKVVHFLAYAILGGLVGLVWRVRRPLSWRVVVLLLVAVAIHGALDEVTQPIFGRHADVADWCADVLGAAVGIGLLAIAARWMIRRRAGVRT